jgi:hypothetical protein
LTDPGSGEEMRDENAVFDLSLRDVPDYELLAFSLLRKPELFFGWMENGSKRDFGMFVRGFPTLVSGTSMLPISISGQRPLARTLFWSV